MERSWCSRERRTRRPINPLLPTAIWMLTSLSLACKASSIEPEQHRYMLPMLDDACNQELVIAAACAGERDRNEKGVKFSNFYSCLPNSRDVSESPPAICRAFTALWVCTM